MSVIINYSKKPFNKQSSNLVLFSDEKFNLNSIKKNLSTTEFSYIKDLLKTRDLKNKLLIFDVSSKKKNNINFNKKKS